MKNNLLTLLCLAALTNLHAAEKLPATLMTERGKLLLSEDFAKPVSTAAKPQKGKAWGEGWRMQVGKWEFTSGALKGSEQKADMHGAVARYPLNFKDAIIQYEVRLDGCRTTTLSINDAKEHICRVLLTPTGFSARKDDHDHDGPDKAQDFGKVAMPLTAGEWHTVVLELKGEEMLASVDGRAVAGAHSLIATDKANFGFTVAGETASFRNLSVWEAKANPAWGVNKKKLTAVAK